MAIQVSGTQVISNSRGLTNIASVDATTAASITAAGVGGGGLAFWNPASTPNATFTSSGTWTKPGGYSDSTTVIFYIVGGGSSGSPYYGPSQGGPGGTANIIAGSMGDMPSSVSIVIGAGGAQQTTFGNPTTHSNPGGLSSLSASGKTYTALGGSSRSGRENIANPEDATVIFPSITNPFSGFYPTPASAQTGSNAAASGLTTDGRGSTFAGGNGGNCNPNVNGLGGVSVYGGNGGGGVYGGTGSAGSVPGGGGGGAYTTPSQIGGAGGNGNCRVYYIS